MRTLELRAVGADRKPGQWWVGTSDGAQKPFWSCPGCGQVHVLATHRVRQDGEVSPSIVCSKCDFHEYATLDEVQPEIITFDDGRT